MRDITATQQNKPQDDKYLIVGGNAYSMESSMAILEVNKPFASPTVLIFTISDTRTVLFYLPCALSCTELPVRDVYTNALLVRLLPDNLQIYVQVAVLECQDSLFPVQSDIHKPIITSIHPLRLTSSTIAR